MLEMLETWIGSLSHSFVGNALRGIREELQGLILPFVLVAIPIAALLGNNWFENQRARYVTFTAGGETGRRHALARDYLPQPLAEANVALTIRPTAGSVEALQSVNDGAIDLALVQGGLDGTSLPNVRQIAALYQEPLHLLLKKETYAAAQKSNLKTALAGKHLYLSTAGSGTYVFAQRVVALAGLTAQDYFEAKLREDDLLAASATLEQLPDAVFLVSLLPSLTAHRLIADFGYRLYPLRFAEAYQLDDNRVSAMNIPAGVYNADPPEPEAPLPTVATRLLLVANKDVPNDVVQRMLTAMFSGDFARVYRPALTLANLDYALEFPLHPGTEVYLNNKLPINRETLQSLQAVWASIAGLLPAVFLLSRWLRSGRGRQKQFATQAKLRTLSEQLIEADKAIHELERAATLRLEDIFALRLSVGSLRTDTLGITDGGNPSTAATVTSLLRYISDLESRLTALRVEARTQGAAPGAGQPPK